MFPRLTIQYILSWNCRGLGNAPTVNALRRIVLIENPQTRLKQHEMDKNKLKFSGMIGVDCAGEGRKRKGGVALLWKNGMDISIQSLFLNHMDAIVDEGQPTSWRLTFGCVWFG